MLYLSRTLYAAVLLLTLQACDYVSEDKGGTNDIRLQETAELQLDAPAILQDRRKIETEALVVDVVLSYSAGGNNYSYPGQATYSNASGSARWSLGVNVPVDVPFTLTMTWLEQDTGLELVRITRDFEGFSSSGRAEFAYRFAATEDFSEDEDAPDYAGFNDDNDALTNIQERLADTDPFDGNDPVTRTDDVARLVAEPATLSLQFDTSESKTVQISLANVGDIPVNFQTSSAVDWMSITPGSGTVAVSESAVLNATLSCPSAEASLSDSIVVSYNGLTLTIPVTLGCSRIPEPRLTLVTSDISEGTILSTAISTEFSFTNSGNALLEYDIESDSNWLVPQVSAGELPQGETETIIVTASCDATVGLRTGNLQVNSNGGTASLSVSLLCSREPAPLLADLSESVSMTTSLSGTASTQITFRNNGDAPLSYELETETPWLTLPAPRGVLASLTNTSIDITGSCDTAAGDRVGEVLLTSDGGDGRIEVALTCLGGVLSELAPLRFDFEATPGQTDQGSMTFSNTGNENLAFTLSSDSNWLCPDHARTGGCSAEQGSFTDSVSPGDSYRLYVAADCPAEPGTFAGSFNLTGSFDEIVIPATLSCARVLPTPVEPSLSHVQPKTYRFDWVDAPDATYYQLLESADGEADYELVEAGIGKDVERYDHVVPLHLRSRASYKLRTCNEIGCVESDDISVQGNLANAIGYIKGADDSGFGKSMDLSGDGSTLAVYHGKTHEVSLYRLAVASEADWILSDTLDFSAYANADSLSAYSVSLNHEGTVLAVGLPQAFVNNCECGAGSVHVYDRRQATESEAPSEDSALLQEEWDLQVILTHPDFGRTNDRFGYTVAINKFGSQVFASVRGGNQIVGFDRESDWESTSSISLDVVYDDLEYISDVGTSMQLSANADVLAINVTSDYNADISKYVNVYRRNVNGEWDLEGALYAPISSECCEEFYGDKDGFGSSMAISADGNTIAVGAPLEDSQSAGINGEQDDDSMDDSGAVYVYTRGDGSWQEQAYIKASNPYTLDFFGYSLSLSDDGNLLAVGAWEEASGALGIGGDETADTFNGVGAGYVFSRAGTQWSQTSYLKPTNLNTNFGEAISISGNGDTLFISSQYLDDIHYY